MQSHIQMPKVVLKYFTGEHHRLYCYDFGKDIISRSSPKSLYTEGDYYSPEVEKFLDVEVETNLGRLIKFFSVTTLDVGTHIPEEFGYISRNYIYSLIARSPSLVSITNKCSVYFQFYPKQFQHDYTVVEAYNMAKEQGMFKDLTVAFMDNRSKEEFVLPTGGVFTYGDKLICPVLPSKAIVLDSEPAMNDTSVAVYLIEDEMTVRNINLKAFEEEKNRDRKYIVSTSKELLSSLRNEYKSNTVNS